MNKSQMSNSSSRPDLARTTSTRSVMSRRSSLRSSFSIVAHSMRKLIRSGDPTWEELQTIEKRRRAILQRTELPFWKILTFWDGTCLRLMVTDPLLWLTLFVYAGVRIQARVSVPDFVEDVQTIDIGVLGGFLSFFLVFFVVQSNQRFFFLYDQAMIVVGRIMDISCMAEASLPRENKLRLIRYLNAAHLAGYVGLGDTYNTHNFFQELNQIYHVLTEKEFKRMNMIDMDTLGSSAQRELVTWCLKEVERAKKDDLIDPWLAEQYRTKILELRAHFATIYDYEDQPISFFYIHFICLLSVFYLPLFAISAGYSAGTGDDVYWTADVVAGLVVLLQSVFVIGLRLLGQKLVDPFGKDLEDLSVLEYATFTSLASHRVLASESPDPLDKHLEEELASKRDLGMAWEDGHSDKGKECVTFHKNLGQDDNGCCGMTVVHDSDSSMAVGDGDHMIDNVEG